MLCNQSLLSLKTMWDTMFAIICIHTVDINHSCKKQRKMFLLQAKDANGGVKQVRDNQMEIITR